MEFNSLSELKERVMPALNLKEERFKLLGHDISSDEIWFFLTKNKWMHCKGLTLNEIVNDILKLNIDEITNKRGDM